MTEPAIDNAPKISASPEEKNRQMEELNKPSSPQGTEEKDSLRDSETDDQDLSLNTEQPLNVENLEKMGEADPGMNEVETPGGLKPEPGTISEQQDTAGITDDEAGTDISDDELWEDDDIEEIPLFEEEFLEQELETEKSVDKSGEAETVNEEDSEAGIDKNPKAEIHEEEQVEAAHRDTVEKPAAAELQRPPETAAAAGTLGQREDEQKEQQQKGSTARRSEGLKNLLPWIATGIAAALSAAAILTIWLIASRADIPNKTVSEPPSGQTDVQQPSSQAALTLSQRPVRDTAQAIDLAPFLIPAHKSGELVFFKLQVELIVPNATTKQKLLKREAWIRDIIYQGLKGINISKGIRGDILTRYRRPLLERLNREMTPLRIEDIRLMGVLLR